MVQRALIDLNTDNGDAKPFANLGLRLPQPRSSTFPDSEIKEKINCTLRSIKEMRDEGNDSVAIVDERNCSTPVQRTE